MEAVILRAAKPSGGSGENAYATHLVVLTVFSDSPASLRSAEE